MNAKINALDPSLILPWRAENSAPVYFGVRAHSARLHHSTTGPGLNPGLPLEGATRILRLGWNTKAVDAVLYYLVRP